MRSVAGWTWRATSSDTNCERNTAITTPPLPVTWRRMSSGTLRRCGDVAEVDQHAEPVHLADHLAPEGGQSAVLRLVGRRVGPARRVPVRQRHVAHATREERPKDRQRARDHVPAL